MVLVTTDHSNHRTLIVTRQRVENFCYKLMIRSATEISIHRSNDSLYYAVMLHNRVGKVSLGLVFSHNFTLRAEINVLYSLRNQRNLRLGKSRNDRTEHHRSYKPLR